MQPRRPRPWSVIAGLLAIVVLAAHGPVLVGGKTWADPAFVTEVTPARLAALDAVGDGQLPGWWDRAGLGAPLWSEPAHGATYPGWWAAAVAPAYATWLLDLLAILHVVWAALGVALLARRLGADDLGALFAGAIFAASGVATGAIVDGSIAAVAHLPWAAWAGDAIARSRDRRGWARGAAALAAAVAAVGLAGRLALAADAVVLGVAAAVARGRELRRNLAGCAAGLGAGALLAAIAVVPAVLHLGGDVVTPAREASTWALAELALPHARRLGGATGPAVLIGGAALLFAVVAVAQSVAGDGRRVLAGVAVALALAGARGPTEHLAAAAVLIVALAGAGWSGLAARRPDRRTFVAAVVAAGALALAVVAIAAARPVLARALAEAGGELDAAVGQVDRALAHAAVAAAVAIGALGLVLVSIRRALPAAIPAAAVLVVGHAVIVGRLERPLEPRANLDAEPAFVSALDGDGHRVYRPLRMSGADDPHQTLEGAVPSRFGLGAARWPAPGRRRAEELLWSASSTEGAVMFDRFAIDLAILPAGVALPAGMPARGERAGWAIVETRARRARGFVAPAWRWFDDDDQAAAAMFPGGGERGLPLGAVARAGRGEPGGPAEVAPVPCEVVDRGADEVELRCRGPAGVAVLLDAWAPGWSVTVDGAPARLERVDVAARGVAVDAGDHVVTFRYAPPGRRLGAWLSLAGLAGLVALIAVGLLPSRRADA